MLCGMLLDNKIINMNNIINKFLLAGDKFMSEMHLRQPQFVYSALRNSAYDIASNPKYDGYQRSLASMVYKFLDSKVAPLGKKTMSGKGIKNNKILAEELHKPVIKKFNKRKVYSQFTDNIWGVDVADMQ